MFLIAGCGASTSAPTAGMADGAATASGATALVPTRDVTLDHVVGVGDVSQLFKDVADGVTFASGNNNTSYVRGMAGVRASSHTVGFSGGPQGPLSQVTVNYRASFGSGQGTAQSFVYDGAQLVATGKVRVLGALANYTDLFSSLNVSGVANLQVKIALTNNGLKGALRYTQVWVEVKAGACVPRSCSALGANCGSLADGCGGTLTCGTCAAGQTCAGAGTPNVCGSTPDGGTSGPDPVIAAAGDISCGPNGRTTSGPSCQQMGTSDLLVGKGFAAVLTLGDNQYESGAPADFQNFYDPSWGRVKPLIRPAVGNHEYGTHGAAGYFGYFGSAAGDPGKGYYSYDIGAWHLIALNTNTPGTNAADPSDCGVVSCKAGSAQEQWLKQDLASHPSACTLVYWHHPRFSSGDHGNAPVTAAFWTDLYAAKVDVVLNGHDHDYERFAPMDPTGAADPGSGIREFVVGTGGVDFRGFHTPLPTSEARNTTAFGILKLTLHATSYDWEFVPQAGSTFTDRGTGQCH